MSRRLKELVAKELAERLKDAQSCILVEYRGLSAEQMNKVRRAFTQQQAKIQVVKNALAAIALEKIGMGALKPFLDGPLAIVRGSADPAVLAKTVSTCTKGFNGIKIRAGFGDGMVFDAAQVKALAVIPPRDVLYAMMLGMINGPMAALASAFNSIQSSLARALQALVEKKEKEAPPPPAETVAPAEAKASAPAQETPAPAAAAPSAQETPAPVAAAPSAQETPAPVAAAPSAAEKPAEPGPAAQTPPSPATEPPKPAGQ